VVAVTFETIRKETANLLFTYFNAMFFFLTFIGVPGDAASTCITENAGAGA